MRLFATVERDDGGDRTPRAAAQELDMGYDAHDEATRTVALHENGANQNVPKPW
jgi:hypothetical protein